MNKQLLSTYYPNGISAEKHMLTEGMRLTSTSPLKMAFVMAAGIALSVFGPIFACFDSEFIIIGLLIAAVGAALLSWGIYGILRYYRGWRYLAIAELLYNTRLASGEPSDAETKTSEQNTPSSNAALSNWKCTCGREHPAYVSTCTCGVNKRDI